MLNQNGCRNSFGSDKSIVLFRDCKMTRNNDRMQTICWHVPVEFRTFKYKLNILCLQKHCGWILSIFPFTLMVTLEWEINQIQPSTEQDNYKGFNQLTIHSDKYSYIKSVYSLCHVDLLKCTERNVNNQGLTQVSQLYIHISFNNQIMPKSSHWWSWSCDLHGSLINHDHTHVFCTVSRIRRHKPCL